MRGITVRLQRKKESAIKLLAGFLLPATHRYQQEINGLLTIANRNYRLKYCRKS